MYLKSNWLKKNDPLLMKMVFQKALYWIWRARNAHMQQMVPNTIHFLAQTIHKDITNRLISLKSESSDDEKGALMESLNHIQQRMIFYI